MSCANFRAVASSPMADKKSDDVARAIGVGLIAWLGGIAIGMGYLMSGGMHGHAEWSVRFARNPFYNGAGIAWGAALAFWMLAVAALRAKPAGAPPEKAGNPARPQQSLPANPPVAVAPARRQHPPVREARVGDPRDGAHPPVERERPLEVRLRDEGGRGRKQDQASQR